MSHANARLTPVGRWLMVWRVEAGMPQAHVARQMGLSRGAVSKWRNRYVAEARPVWLTRRRGLVAALGAPRPASRSGSAGCGAAPGARRCICRRALCGGSSSATARSGSPGSTGPPGG